MKGITNFAIAGDSVYIRVGCKASSYYNFHFMLLEENVYKTIRYRSNFILRHGHDWAKELSSAKNYIATPDLKNWTFGKSAGLDKTYHANGGAAKKWLYSIGFLDVLKLENGTFNESIIHAFLNWASKVSAFDISEKFERDQTNNRRFEILVHSSIIPKSLLQKTNISISNQMSFTEGFKKEVSREVAVRDRRVIELVKRKYGITCHICTFDFGLIYGTHGYGFIEMHHLNPINLGKRKTKVTDLRPVCSNCHRMLHKGERLLTIDELKQIIQNQRKDR
jgi:predicted HNH restriction endonuclease